MLSPEVSHASMLESIGFESLVDNLSLVNHAKNFANHSLIVCST